MPELSASDGAARTVMLFSGPCDTESAYAVRQRLASIPDVPMPPPMLRDCQLIATELVTNAVNAFADWLDVELIANDSGFELRVHDTAAGVPRPRHSSLSDTGGRGLHIIEAIAAAWGFQCESDGGKTVWARLEGPEHR